jgi:integrase
VWTPYDDLNVSSKRKVLMRYCTVHQGHYWFQIRVPNALQARLGSVIRSNLHAPDAATARLRALQLAADWHTAFAAMLGRPVDSSVTTSNPRAFEPPPPGGFEYEPTPTFPTKAGRLGSPAGSRGRTLVNLFEYWRDLTPARPGRTVIEFEATAEDFDRRIAVSAAELSRRDIAAYRDLLLHDGLQPATVTKRIGFVNALLQAATDAGHIPSNVGRGLRTPRPKVEAPGRGAFTREELLRIFSSPVYSSRLRPSGGGGEAAAWLPALGLTTGARLEELCQLRPSDVELEGADGPLVHIRDNDPEKRLKTASSRRVVPVHAELVRIGFLPYVRQQQVARSAWLLPDLVQDRFGSRGGNWGRWFGRDLRSADGCAVPDPARVFHSFRHSFKQLCREARIIEETHDFLTGHGSVSNQVGRGYGSVPMVVLVEAMSTLRFPVTLPVIWQGEG